jgi:putative flavoprotein involved in K+ transport
MRRTETIIVGGGQAGLAMSRALTELGVDHVILERGRIGERWRSERWDSLRLLTPRWMTRLPGHRYDGPDPDGFMTMPETVAMLERYARSVAAPVEEHTTVRWVAPVVGGYRVITDTAEWRAENVVIATGHCDVPKVPEMAAGLPRDVRQLVPTRYRSPDDLPKGGVLVVGASSTGAQLADELHASGRPVTLAVGRHTRMPRRYRGRDVLAWLDESGVLDERAEDLFDVDASRAQPSLQLVGPPDHRSLDLGVLARRGVRLAGHLRGIQGGRVSFADDLGETTRAADRKLARVLARIDEHIRISGARAERAEPVAPIAISGAPRELDLRRHGIRSVIWATGYSRKYPWLKVPVVDESGEIVHRGGVTSAPGLYVLGLFLMRTRKSSFIDGVGADARALASHIAVRTGRAKRAAA